MPKIVLKNFKIFLKKLLTFNSWSFLILILYQKRLNIARYKYISKILHYENLYKSNFIKNSNFKKKNNKTSIYKAYNPYKYLFYFYFTAFKKIIFKIYIKF